MKPLLTICCFLLQIIKDFGIKEFRQSDIKAVTEHFNCYNPRIFANSIYYILYC